MRKTNLKTFHKNSLTTFIEQFVKNTHCVQLNRLVVGSILAGSMIASPNVFAARLGFVTTNIQVDEPNSGSRTVSVQPSVSFDDNDQSWNNLDPCTISGAIEVYQLNRPVDSTATQDVDFTIIGSTSFSMTTQPVALDGGMAINNLSQDILFEILDDGDEDEAQEFIDFRISSYGLSCNSGLAGRTLSVSSSLPYGSILITDPFDQKPPPAPPQPTTRSTAIPIRQKSLSSQLNNLRALTLETSNTRNRSIAKEINRSRQSGGFNSDNLHVKVNGNALPQASLLGRSAGEALEDFGRWGYFLSGSVDIGETQNDVSTSDYDSSMVIAGLDYRATDNIVIGAALSHTLVDSGNASVAETDFKRNDLSVFASFYQSDKFYADAIITTGSSAYDLNRKIVTDATPESAQAETDGDESSAALGMGYNIYHQNINFRFFSLLNYVDANIDSYQERVTGSAAAANVNDIDLQSLTLDLGLETSWNINTQSGVYSPMISLALEHQFADDAVDITGSFVGEGSFYYHAPDRDNDYLNAQIGFNGVFKNGLTAYFTYDTYLKRDDLSSHHYSLGFRWQL